MFLFLLLFYARLIYSVYLLGLATRFVSPSTGESTFSCVNSVLLPPIRGRTLSGGHSGHHCCLSLGRFILVVATLSLGVLLHQFISHYNLVFRPVIVRKSGVWPEARTHRRRLWPTELKKSSGELK